MIIPIAIFFISAAALGLELVLLRALSIGHWHHFSYLVISTALLGFGAGAIFTTIASKFLTKNYRKSLWCFALLLAFTAPFLFRISQKVPFDELQLIWDWRQILYLFAYYLLFFVPFFFAGACVALSFTVCADRAHSLYFYNMAGSGLGAASIVALMYAGSPEQLLLVISGTAFLAAFILAIEISWRWSAGALICAAICIFTFSPAGPGKLTIKISENKSLVYYRALPGAKTLARRHSPLARLDCIDAASIRHFPDLSIAYNGLLPRQILIISDADSVSAVNHFEDFSELRCYDYTTSALCYHLLSQPNVCVIGAGGGSDVAQALLHKACKVTAVEMNPQIIDLVRNRLNEFASGLYRRSDVEVIAAEGRNLLQTTKKHFDVIIMSLLDSFSCPAAGVYALNESHLYTIEAIDQALSKLQLGGVLSITRTLKLPPRDSLKLFATVVQALRNRGISNPAEYLIMIRSWATATIVASGQPFSDEQIAKARKFAAQRCFDLVYVPGIQPNEINRFHVLEEPIFYQAAQQLLSEKKESFYRSYIYDIRPATDDKPYFFNFFRFKALPHMIRTMPGQWLPFSEWGYLVLVATLLQAICAGVVFILLPLLITRPVRAVKSGKFATLIFFLLLGLAYMFLEMGFIQKMTLLIGRPVFGVAVTLLGFLVFSGCGSLASEHISYLLARASGHGPKVAGHISRFIWIATSAIIIIGITEIVFLKLSFNWLVGFPLASRCLLGVAITGPLAFFMGMPLPTAIKQLNIDKQTLIPWAWGINGFASVIGAVLGMLLAISAGFTVLAFLALGGYFLAAAISRQMFD